MNKYVSEAIGTFITFSFLFIVFFFSYKDTTCIIPAFAAAFLYFFCYIAMNKICFCHFNPAITLSFYIAKRIELRDSLKIILAQFIGCLGSIALILVFMGLSSTTPSVIQNYYGASGFDEVSIISANTFSSLFIEFILIFVFIFIFLKTFDSKKESLQFGILISVLTFVVVFSGFSFCGGNLNPFKSLCYAVVYCCYGSFLPIIMLFTFFIVDIVASIAATILYKRILPHKPDDVFSVKKKVHFL